MDKSKGIEKFLEMLKITKLLSEEELEAMDHQIPMTQELFDSILKKMTGQGIEDSYLDFMNEFSEFLSEKQKKY